MSDEVKWEWSSLFQSSILCCPQSLFSPKTCSVFYTKIRIAFLNKSLILSVLSSVILSHLTLFSLPVPEIRKNWWHFYYGNGKSDLAKWDQSLFLGVYFVGFVCWLVGFFVCLFFIKAGLRICIFCLNFWNFVKKVVGWEQCNRGLSKELKRTNGLITNICSRLAFSLVLQD